MDGSALFRHLERTRLSAEVPGTERTLVSAENRGKVKLRGNRTPVEMGRYRKAPDVSPGKRSDCCAAKRNGHAPRLPGGVPENLYPFVPVFSEFNRLIPISSRLD